MLVSASTYLDALFLLLGDNSDRSKDLVKQFVAKSEKDTARKDFVTSDDDLISAYKSLIKSVINEQISTEDKTASKILLLKIKSLEVFKSHPVERDILTDVLTAETPISDKQIDEYLKKIRNALLLAEIDEFNRKIFAKTKTAYDVLDADQQEAELFKIKAMFDDTVKSIEHRQATSEAKASETYVSLSDKESIKRALDVFVDRNVKGVVKTGLHGLNKALGTRGGFGLGETWVFAARSHNYKSGMLVSIMLWAVVYNTFIAEPGKKVLIYFVSLENEVNQNLMDMFKALYCRVEKRHVDLNEISTEYITEWLLTYFSKFGIELIIDRYTPHEFSFSQYMKRYNAFVEQGYQIVLFDLDYMSEARGIDPGDTFSSQGQIQLIKENYLKFANHAKACGYLLTTGHQLTKRAAEIAANDRYAVKKYNASMMADSSDVERIIDGLVFMELSNNIEGFKFLTMQNRKNRGCKDTPEKDKFCAYPFTEFGIEDDIDGVPQYVTDIDAWGNPGSVTDASIVEAAMF